MANKKTITQIIVPIDKLVANQWNPMRQDSFMFDKMKESLTTFDFIYPVVVREIKEGYEIIDGEHRWRAARELGKKEIPVITIGEIDDITARKLTIILNETRGEVDTLKLAQLVKYIQDNADLTLLPYTPEKIQGLFELLDMPEYNKEEPDEDAKDQTFIMFRVTFKQKQEIYDIIRQYCEENKVDENTAFYQLITNPHNASNSIIKTD